MTGGIIEIIYRIQIFYPLVRMAGKMQNIMPGNCSLHRPRRRIFNEKRSRGWRLTQDSDDLCVHIISNPFPPDLRAVYAVMEADENGYTIHHRRVDYDREAVVQAVREVNHPASDYIERYMKWKNKKDWMK